MQKDFFRRTVLLGIIPSVFYLLFFILLTFPAIQFFSSHYYCDTGDGLQNIWNLWWVNKSITELGESPWQTSHFYYPDGITLIAHTLNPFNGFLGILLHPLFPPIQTHNLVVIFSFVMGGITAFWLAFSFSRSYGGSLLGGFIFTFSSFHFTHAQGHMQLISLEWVPLFILCWNRLITKPDVARSVASSLSLFLVTLCDYYYLLFCIMSAVIIFLGRILIDKPAFSDLTDQYLKPGFIFLIVTLATTGPLVFALLRISAIDPLLGSHNPYQFSMDLLAPFIPGSHWYFSKLTQNFWLRYPDMIHESSVYVGWSVLALAGVTWFKRPRWKRRETEVWFFIFFFFVVMALGPTLHVWGKEVGGIKLPYALLQWIFPPLEMAGVPIRMMIIAQLAAAILGAYGIQILMDQKRFLPIALLIVLLGFEFYPKPIPLTHIPLPEWVRFLKKQSHKGALIDFETPGNPLPLYFQTHHEMPLATGFVSRLPESVNKKFREIQHLVRKEQFTKLSDKLGFQYFLTTKDPKILQRHSSLKLIHVQSPFHMEYQGKTYPIYKTTLYLYELEKKKNFLNQPETKR